MHGHSDDDLPPEFEGVADRLRSARPEADEHVVDRMLTRARASKPSRAKSLLWGSPARTGTRPRAVAVASVVAIVGLTASAVAINSSGTGESKLPIVRDASAVQYAVCPEGVVAAQLAVTQQQTLVNLLVQILPANNQTLIDAKVTLAGLQAELLVCQGLI